jgi:hypothetical protein
MPLYDFISDDESVIEAFAPSDVRELVVDGKRYVRRPFHIPNVVYYGEGFHTTDYAPEVVKWARRHAQGEEPEKWV